MEKNKREKQPSPTNELTGRNKTGASSLVLPSLFIHSAAMQGGNKIRLLALPLFIRPQRNNWRNKQDTTTRALPQSSKATTSKDACSHKSLINKTRTRKKEKTRRLCSPSFQPQQLRPEASKQKREPSKQTRSKQTRP